MKKTVLAIAAVATLGLAGYQLVDAHPGGWGPGMGNGYGMMGPGGRAVDEATIKAREKFFNDTAALRRQIAAKQTELYAVTNSATPDEKKAAKLSEELFDLRSRMQEKAAASGLTTGNGYGGYFCGGPFGNGNGYGPRHYGRGW